MVVIPQLRDDYGSWGRITKASHHVAKPRQASDVLQLLTCRKSKALAYGCGRSYGDVALNPDGLLIDCRALDKFIAFERSTGILICEAGVRLADILSVVCRTEGDGDCWFLPVSPGTQFVTVGGAIANDIHGKNHHLRGTFGRHLLSLDLARSDGSVFTCSANENKELFAATIGGLGLTGVILRATVQLRRVEGFALEAEDIRFGSLDELWELISESDKCWEYTAAWIDCLKAGPALGRGVLSRARHTAQSRTASRSHRFSLKLPRALPVSLVNRNLMRAFNAVHWFRARSSCNKHRASHYEPILYPLDGIDFWNRLYGPTGFFQFQCVVPPNGARDIVAEMLRHARKGGATLGVLKSFGTVSSPGLLSFPMLGWTLALDFPNRGKGTLQLLSSLEAIVADVGGRIYPAKDSVMRRDTFERGYPRLQDFLPMVDPGVSSGFAQRMGIL
jgi:FAD/FMN-containing dehydrogenase